MDKGYAERHWESKIAEFVCIRCSTLNHSIFFCFCVWQESSVFTLRKTNTVNKETIMSGRNK